MRMTIQRTLSFLMILLLLIPQVPLYAEEQITTSQLTTGKFPISSIEDVAFPANSVTLQLPAQEMSQYPDTSTFVFELYEEGKGAPISLIKKVVPQASLLIKEEGLHIEKKESNWPSSIKIRQLDKIRDEKQIVYRAHLYNLKEGKASSLISEPIFFDTLAPTLSPALTFDELQKRETDGKTTYFTGNKIVHFSFGVEEKSNGIHAANLPLRLSIQKENAQGASVYTKLFTENGNFYDSFELPDHFSGNLTFTLSDKAGNTSTQNNTFIIDTTSPHSYGTTPVTATQTSISKELLLDLSVTDEESLDTTIEIAWSDTQKRSFVLPAALFSQRNTILQGSYPIALSLLPGFPEGRSTDLSVGFYDKAGNKMLVKNLTTTIDSASPVINNLNYLFSNNKKTLQVAFRLEESSPVTVYLGNKVLLEEGGNPSTSRILTFNDISLDSLQFPLIFSVNDQKNPPSTFTIDDGYTLLKGKKTSDYKIPLTYMVPESYQNVSVHMDISGGTLSSPISQSFQGLTNTFLLGDVGKGTYKVRSTLTRDNAAPSVYVSEISITENLTPPHITDLALGGENATALIVEDQKEHFYTTKEQDLRVSFRVQATKTSTPLKIKINGETVKTLDFVPEDLISIPLHIPTNNVKNSMTLSVQDSSNNAAASTFTIIRDTKPPQAVSISLLTGNDSTQEKDAKLSKSTESGLYLTKSPTFSMNIHATEEGAKAPKVIIKKNNMLLVGGSFLEETVKGSHLYSFTQKDIAIDAGNENIFLVSVEDDMQNKVEQTFRVKNATAGPKILEAVLNAGEQKTNAIHTSLSLKAEGAGHMTYQLSKDTLVVASGEFDAEGKAQSIIALPQLGTNTFTLTVTDELGLSTTSAPISIVLDYKNPLYSSVVVPWKDATIAPTIKVTLTGESNSYSAILSHKKVISIADMISQISDTRIQKIPIGTYSLHMEPVGNSSDVSPKSLDQQIEITPYYFDADGDLNGNGYNSGLTDEKLFRSAKQQGDIYSLVQYTPYSVSEELLNASFLEKCKSLSGLMSANAQIKTEEFLTH